MVLNEQEVGDIYLTVKDVLLKSKVYDDGIIPTIYTLLIKSIFNELPIFSCRCKILKSQYLIGQVSIGQKEHHKDINYYNQDAYYTEDIAIKAVGNILNKTIGLNDFDKHISSDSENEIYTMNFIIAPTFDSFGDSDLYYIFKVFQMYSHDVIHEKSGYCYEVFKNLIKCIFDDFENSISIWNEDNYMYCIFINPMEEQIARNTLINYFDFKEDTNLFTCANGFYIDPIDHTDYNLYMEDKE